MMEKLEAFRAWDSVMNQTLKTCFVIAALRELQGVSVIEWVENKSPHPSCFSAMGAGWGWQPPPSALRSSLPWAEGILASGETASESKKEEGRKKKKAE